MLLVYLGSLSVVIGMMILFGLMLLIMLGNYGVGLCLLGGIECGDIGVDLWLWVLVFCCVGILVVFLMLWLYSCVMSGIEVFSDFGLMFFIVLL